MATASSVLNSNLKRKRNDLSPIESSKPQSRGAKGGDVTLKPMEPTSADNVSSGKLTTSENGGNNRHNSGDVDVDADNCLGKNSSKLPCKRRKNASQTMRGSRYPLRSSKDGIRVLRSRSLGSPSAPIGSPSAPSVSTSTSVNQVTKIKRKKKQLKQTTVDEFTRIRKHVRYLLARMNYEQNLLDAYSGEGWKGQSLEKIRPEKELERAKSEILRRKLKIREAFRHLESLLSEGRLEDSLFDDEGEISSEDITCAKCGSKDSAVDNDIILCDGTCDRGFHQKCLNPPLLTENIPSDEEGWLCPACDCKVDCLDFLNEIQGIDLSVEDTWEKVFPEAAAIANGDVQHGDLGLPSDDSEDDDFNPDAPDIDVDNEKEGSSSEESSSGESYYTLSEHSDSGDSNPKDSNTLGLPSDDSEEDDDYDPDGPDPEEMVHKDGSSLEESDFTSDSDEFMEEINKASDVNEVSSSLPPHLMAPGLSAEDRHLKDTLELPSDDSEDDDYDPDGPDPEEMVHKDGSSLEESDFTSDSDEFMEEINKASDVNEISSSLPSHLKTPGLSAEDSHLKDKLKSSKNPELLSILEPDMNGENTLLVSGKRQRENLDYKKLYDETYGEASSDSSDDDDDWSDMTIAKKAKNVDTKDDSVALPKKNTSKICKGELTEVNATIGAHVDQSQVPRVTSTRGKVSIKLDLGAANQSAAEEHTESLDPDSSGNKGSFYGKFGRLATQRLLESFKEKQYPSGKTKESLAEELGITVQQVSKWFENARRSARAVAKEGQAVFPTPTKIGTDSEKTTPKSGQAVVPTPTKIVTDSEKTTPKSGEAVFSTPTKSNGTTKTDTNSKRTTRRSVGKTSDLTGNSESGAENGVSNGVNAKAMDEKRQKAITKELRKRKKR